MMTHVQSTISNAAVSILPLDSGHVSLERGGGKGMNLARLVRAGLPVPGGFIVSTAAYCQFIAANDLDSAIQAVIADLAPDDPLALEAASAAIRQQFRAGRLPDALKHIITEAYLALGMPAVAVRSSATAEDLPDLSFAGQQDTLLNVQGQAALLNAIIACWGSLWTARAIGYRARNGLSQHDLALAVVVQAMVPSEASGVLFTANPLTGKRSETVIDATLGLGEALVSGQVEPDQYIVDTAHQRIIAKQLGAKAVIIQGRAGGGTTTRDQSAARQQALPDDAIVALTRLGRGIAALFNAPQDIEWAWADGQLWILQSRPITSLFPLPVSMSAMPLQVLLSVGAVQGVLDPLTPLGRDLFCHLAAGSTNYFGLQRTPATQTVLYEAGERLFVNITGAVQHPLARRLLRGVLRIAEPASGEVLESIWHEPALQLMHQRFSLRAYLRVGRLLRRVVGSVMLNLLRPARRRAQLYQRIERVISAYAQEQQHATTLAARFALFERTPAVLGSLLLPVLLPMVASGMAALRLLNLLAAQLPDGSLLALRATRGLPHNVTTEMDLALWDVARAIRRDSEAAACFTSTEPAALATALLAGRLPNVAQSAIKTFLQHYGMRGIAEIDLGHSRWRDQPEPLMQALTSYLQIDDPDRAPDAIFTRGAAEATAAIAQIARGVRSTRFGWLKAQAARWAARRVRALAGLRETPKFTFIRIWGLLRDGLLASGRELVADGILDQSDDLFFLNVAELRALAQHPQRDWQALVAKRRAAYAREQRRRQVPRLLLSDGRAFFDGVAASGDTDAQTLAGSPVSPGTVEGIVHVVLDPHGTRLVPGEILVCHGTDPAWTPLFLAAGGLVMEVGGLMTHGSVVAREYGIPAVVGVERATSRLRSGQRIRVDGTTGRVTLLDTPDGPADEHAHNNGGAL